MNKVFICYRREDTKLMVDRAYNLLKKRFNVIRDINAAEAAKPFEKQLFDHLKSSSIMLVFIGDNWESQDGADRLNHPDDYIRREIELAIEHKLPILPVIVGERAFPTADQLPDSLQPLLEYQALRLRSDPDFKSDYARLTKAIIKFAPPTIKRIILGAVIIIAMYIIISHLVQYFIDETIDTTASNYLSDFDNRAFEKIYDKYISDRTIALTPTSPKQTIIAQMNSISTQRPTSKPQQRKEVFTKSMPQHPGEYRSGEFIQKRYEANYQEQLFCEDIWFEKLIENGWVVVGATEWPAFGKCEKNTEIAQANIQAKLFFDRIDNNDLDIIYSQQLSPDVTRLQSKDQTLLSLTQFRKTTLNIAPSRVRLMSIYLGMNQNRIGQFVLVRYKTPTPQFSFFEDVLFELTSENEWKIIFFWATAGN